MNRTHRHAAVAAALAAAAFAFLEAAPAAAQGGGSPGGGSAGNSAANRGADTARDLAPGTQYEPKTRIRAAASGVSWVLPDAWLGGIPQGQSLFLMGSNTEPGVGGVFLLTGASGDEVASQMTGPQDLGDGVVLEPSGPLEQPAEDRMIQDYAGGEYAGRALALWGPAGQCAVYFFAGPEAEMPRYRALLDGLAASTRFFKPDDGGVSEQWRRLLAGMMLKRMSSYTSGTSGGYSSEATLHLCADGRFSYSSSSVTSIDVPGASASGVGQDASTGGWSLESEGTAVVLVLRHDRGEVTRHALGYDGEKTFLDGERVFRVESDGCP
jgi:hypothetical protein